VAEGERKTKKTQSGKNERVKETVERKAHALCKGAKKAEYKGGSPGRTSNREESTKEKESR